MTTTTKKKKPTRRRSTSSRVDVQFIPPTEAYRTVERWNRRERAPIGARHRRCVWCGRTRCVDDCALCGKVYECFHVRDEDWRRLPRRLRRRSLCATCFAEASGLPAPPVASGRGSANRISPTARGEGSR